MQWSDVLVVSLQWCLLCLLTLYRSNAVVSDVLVVALYRSSTVVSAVFVDSLPF